MNHHKERTSQFASFVGPLLAFFAGGLLSLTVALSWSGRPQNGPSLGTRGLGLADAPGAIPGFVLGTSLLLLGAVAFLRPGQVRLARYAIASIATALALSFLAAGVQEGAGGLAGGSVGALLPGWWGRAAALLVGIILLATDAYVL